ncbi:hypothetical protein SMICM17S_10703 [Streptomyces microflavus]
MHIVGVPMPGDFGRLEKGMGRSGRDLPGEHMATVNRYLCPVAPGKCPSSPRRGFCPTTSGNGSYRTARI